MMLIPTWLNQKKAKLFSLKKAMKIRSSLPHLLNPMKRPKKYLSSRSTSSARRKSWNFGGYALVEE